MKFPGLDGSNDVSAGFFIRLEFEEVSFFGLEEEFVERAETVGAFVETGVAAFEGLLDHGTPDRIVFATFFGEGVESGNNLFEGLVEGGAGWVCCVRGSLLGSRFLGACLGDAGVAADGGFLGGGLADEIVVIDELVAVVEEEVGSRVLDADADDRLRVFAQFRDEGGEVGVATDNDEGIDVSLGVAEVEGIDDHADVGGILARLAEVRDFDEFEGGFVEVALGVLVALEVAVGLLDDDMALEEEALKDLVDLDAGIFRLAGPEDDVFEIEVDRHGGVGGRGC